MNSEFDDYMYALREIENLSKRLESEYQRGYSRGYSVGLLKGQEQLAKYMELEVRSTCIKKEDFNNMDKIEMLKQRKENYRKWFDRWIKKYDLRKRIEVANNKNYTRLSIPVHNTKEERDKKMMLDVEFITMLEDTFTGFKISREVEIKDRYFLGNKIGQVAINNIYIDWS